MANMTETTWHIKEGEAEGAIVNFVTSDQHLGHENIIKFTNRPFSSANHMNAMLMQYWNEMVTPEDAVLVLGDIALGSITDSLNWWTQFNGLKLLVPGNHDRVSSAYNPTKRANSRVMYEDAGFIILDETILLEDNNGREMMASHYPYKGDSKETARYLHLRPEDSGLPLIHGHIHSSEAVTGYHERQYHVGVDAHNYRPIPMSTITAWVNSL